MEAHTNSHPELERSAAQIVEQTLDDVYQRERESARESRKTFEEHREQTRVVHDAPRPVHKKRKARRVDPHVEPKPRPTPAPQKNRGPHALEPGIDPGFSMLMDDMELSEEDRATFTRLRKEREARDQSSCFLF